MMIFSNLGRQKLLAFFRGIFIYLVLAIIACPSTAVGIGRPSKKNGPTRVHLALYIIDVDEVNNVTQTFDANVLYELHWRDPRLAHEGPDEISRSIHDGWHPRIQFVNQQKIWKTLPEIVNILPDGEVIYRQRFWGTFSQPLELRDFPLDRQTFAFQLIAAGYGPQEVDLVNDDSSRTGISTHFSVVDWDILDWELTFKPFSPSLSEEQIAGANFSMQAQRRYGYYIGNVFIPLVLIVIMSWVVFWIDPKESGTQISVSMTTMLTLIAYRFAVGTNLPKVSLLNRLDYFILAATILVFASLIEVVVTSAYANSGALKRARMIDRWARILFPATFFLVAYESLFARFVF